MAPPLYTIVAAPPENPRAVYFTSRKQPAEVSSEKASNRTVFFEQVTRRVASLAIEPVAGNLEGLHCLVRLDVEGCVVWRTRHPSLQETFWHAEWEYGVTQEQWTAGAAAEKKAQ